MALGGVFMTDLDGNIGVESTKNSDKICGLVFDISGQGENFWTTTAGAKAAAAFKDNVVELKSIDDAIDGGIEAYTGLTSATAANYLLNGVAYYHIKKFFDIAGTNGTLYVMFADCKSDWNALVEMQNASRGYISQIGIWTEQNLWKKVSDSSDSYSLELVSGINTVMSTLANDYHAPATVILNANTATIATGSTVENTVTLSKIPTAIGTSRYVSVVLGQDISDDVAAMQASLTSKTPVGVVGIVLGCLVNASVSECIGWVSKFDVSNYISDIEMGFGDVTLSDGAFASTTAYKSLKRPQVDALDDKGYVFLCTYAGSDGIYFSGDATCSDGDYRTIARNRAINKSRRLVRAALLPYVNAPLKIDPTTGHLSTSQITVFYNLVSDVLTTMVGAEELSGIGAITIPANQNVLKTDKISIKYTCVPIGTSKEIDVEDAFVVSQ